MKYIPTKDRVFRTRGEAQKWVDDQKKKLGAGGRKYKTDINYLPETDQWEAELLMKSEEK